MLLMLLLLVSSNLDDDQSIVPILDDFRKCEPKLQDTLEPTLLSMREHWERQLQGSVKSDGKTT